MIEKKLQLEIKKYNSILKLNEDISKQKINNKLKNVNFAMKYEVFANILKHINCATDTSIAYIPIKYIETPIINDKGGISYMMKFLPPNEENNYADLSILNNFTYFNFKFVRVKSLESIELDGSHITWNKKAISDNNYLVFYSINPNEMNNIVIMTTNVYTKIFVSNNYMLHANLLNYKYLKQIKEKLHLTDNDIKIIDYSNEPTFSDFEQINVNIKFLRCLKTLKEINKNPLFFTKKKTHFGKRYIAYNIHSGNKIVFRDCVARNNFFKNNTNIKLMNNRSMSRNCKNQDLLVNGEDLDKYQMNIYEKEGWVITNYISNDEELKNYIQTLFHKLVAFSTQWKNRLIDLLAELDKIIIKVIDKIILYKEKLKNKISYFRPLHLLNYVTCTDNVNMNNYFTKYSYMKKFYK